MQATAAMNTNGDLGNWEYAGCVQDKRKPGQNLPGSQKKHNRKHSSIRARVEHDQAAVWIHQDPLPRTDEECRPGEHADGLGQPVPAALAVADGLRGNPLKMPLKADDEPQTEGIRQQNPAEC